MNFIAKVLITFGILCTVFLKDNSVLGDCGSKIVSPLAACLPSVNGKCPHGMLRLDSDKKSYSSKGQLTELYDKACGKNVRKYDAQSTDSDSGTIVLDPRACCLLTSSVDIKVKSSPCTSGGTTGS